MDCTRSKITCEVNETYKMSSHLGFNSKLVSSCMRLKPFNKLNIIFTNKILASSLMSLENPFAGFIRYLKVYFCKFYLTQRYGTIKMWSDCGYCAFTANSAQLFGSCCKVLGKLLNCTQIHKSWKTFPETYCANSNVKLFVFRCILKLYDIFANILNDKNA